LVLSLLQKLFGSFVIFFVIKWFEFSRIDLAKEKLMDVERFRDQYLNAANQPKGKAAKTLAPWPGEKKAGSGDNSAAEAYRIWVQEQARKSGLQTQQVAKVDAETVLSELESDDRRRSETTDRLEEKVSIKAAKKEGFVRKYRSPAERDPALSNAGLEVGCLEQIN